MTQVKNDLGVTINYTASITMTEGQLRALSVLASYGDGAFLDRFKEGLGKTFITPVEQDVKDLFTIIRREVNPTLAKIDGMKKYIDNILQQKVVS